MLSPLLFPTHLAPKSKPGCGWVDVEVAKAALHRCCDCISADPVLWTGHGGSKPVGGARSHACRPRQHCHHWQGCCRCDSTPISYPIYLAVMCADLATPGACVTIHVNSSVVSLDAYVAHCLTDGRVKLVVQKQLSHRYAAKSWFSRS